MAQAATVSRPVQMNRMRVVFGESRGIVHPAVLLHGAGTPFAKTSDSLRALLPRAAVLGPEEAAIGHLYVPENPNAPDVWNEVVPGRPVSWRQLTDFLRTPQKLGGMLPNDARLTARVDFGTLGLVTATIMTVWGDKGEPRHFVGLRPQDNPDFAYYEGTRFLVKE